MSKKIIFTLIVLMIFSALAEGIARLIYPFWYKKHKEEMILDEATFYAHDPLLGWRMSPNFNGIRHVANVACQYKTNSLGFRDKEYPFHKPKGVYRIICLGDSITEGMGVNDEGSYPKILEALFGKDDSNLKVEGMNFGVVDYGIDQEYILLKEIGLKFNPDVVIVGYFLNDGRGFAPSKAIYLKSKTLDNLISKSKLLYLMDKAIMKYRIKYQYKKWNKDRHEFWMPVYEDGLWRTEKKERYRLIELAKRDWGLAWTDLGWIRTKAFLDKLLGLKNKNNFKLVFVAFPINIQFYADDSDFYMFIPQEKLRKYCQENKVPFVDMLPIFSRYKEDKIFIDYCHPTPLGLELTAKAIYDVVKDEIQQ